MGTLKTETLQSDRLLDAINAQTEIFACIDGKYNTKRLHSSLHYQIPAQVRDPNLPPNLTRYRSDRRVASQPSLHDGGAGRCVA